MIKEELFKPVSERMAHLILNYIASYFHHPIIVFQPEEKQAYQASLENYFATRLFMASKVREAVFNVEGQVLYKVGGAYASDWYKMEGSSSKNDLIVEWHELFRKMKEWEKSLK